MKKLYITYAEVRRLHGNEVYHRASRFIQEVPAELMEEVRLKAAVRRPMIASEPTSTWQKNLANDAGFKMGQRVRHPSFGEGTILNFEGSGDHARVQVKFSQAGTKWLVAAYARLEAI
jgi:DNA helicase-2/ATP-dependent DNA helicase PcrA